MDDVGQFKLLVHNFRLPQSGGNPSVASSSTSFGSTDDSSQSSGSNFSSGHASAGAGVTTPLTPSSSFADSQASGKGLSQKRKWDGNKPGDTEQVAKIARGKENELSLDQQSQKSESNKTGNQDGSVCKKCLEIDFDNFSTNIRTLDYRGHGKVVRSLDYVNENSRCALCKFFIEMKPGARTSDLRGQRLIAHAASRKFRISSVGVADVPLFAICSKEFEGKSKSGKFFLKLDSGDHGLLAGRKITPTIDWSTIAEWLTFCRTHHTKFCVRKHYSPLSGLRVIDCHTRKIIPLQNPFAEYVTLSYVWGSGEVAEDFRNTLPLKIPAVVEDAILSAKQLGYRYLWVDRYCIPQGNSREKHRLIQNMGGVYESSELTLVAAAGDGPHHGLPGVASILRKPQPAVKIGAQLFVSALSEVENEINKSKWNSRGWTYQEALLSRRKLVFTPSQVYFQCAGMCCQESISMPLQEMHTKNLQEYRFDVAVPKVFPSRGVGKLPVDITQRISEYSRRSLSYDSDALKAFQGILRAFEQMKEPVAHFYGLPVFRPASSKVNPSDTDCLVDALSWGLSGYWKRRRGLPSWTWAGWKPRPPKPPFQQLTDLKHEYYQIHESFSAQSCVEISLQHGNGKKASVIACEGNLDAILQSPKLEDQFPLLRLRGLLFQLELYIEDIEYEDVRIRSPSSPELFVVRNLDIAMEDARNIEVKGVVMATDPILAGSRLTLILLVAKSEGQLHFERVGYAYVNLVADLGESVSQALIRSFAAREEEVVLG